MHLGANLLGLYFFGRDVGQLFGGRKARAWAGWGLAWAQKCEDCRAAWEVT